MISSSVAADLACQCHGPGQRRCSQTVPGRQPELLVPALDQDPRSECPEPRSKQAPCQAALGFAVSWLHILQRTWRARHGFVGESRVGMNTYSSMAAEWKEAMRRHCTAAKARCPGVTGDNCHTVSYPSLSSSSLSSSSSWSSSRS